VGLGGAARPAISGYVRLLLPSATSEGLGHWYFARGALGDIPLQADFDGDGKADVTVYGPSTGEWFILFSSRSYRATEYGHFALGVPGDVPRVGDFDSDGIAEVAVFRPATGQWFILYSSRGYSTAQPGAYAWGALGDLPMVDDFDSNGRARTSRSIARRPAGGSSASRGTATARPASATSRGARKATRRCRSTDRAACSFRLLPASLRRNRQVVGHSVFEIGLSSIAGRAVQGHGV
jgi:hypothetical protein